MEAISVSDLRISLATTLDRVAHGERIAITRDGEPVAALVSVDEAAWAAALAARFRNRLPPFTQAALDAWVSESLRNMSVCDLLGATAGVD